MERNGKIMLAVFEKFLANPIKFKFGALTRQELDDVLDSYIPYELQQFNKNTLRWHVVMFVSEFALKHDFARANFGEYQPPYGMSPRPEKLQFSEPTDYLNWSGRDLYERLKTIFQKRKQSKKKKE